MAYSANPNGYTTSMPAMGTVEMGLEVSRKVLPKIFAKEAYHKGYMINDRYNEEAQRALDVLIPKFNRPTGKFKNIRGGSYDPFTVTKDKVTQKYDVLSIDMEYNEIIEIAEDQIIQNIQGDSVISTMVDMISRIVAEQLNVLTADGIINANLSYNSGKEIEDMKIQFVDTASATLSIPDYITGGVAKIGNADPAMGDTSFNDYRVSQVISNTLWSLLLRTKNQFILESSYGQELLIEGTFGRITLGDVTAFKGKIVDCYTFVLPDAFFPYNGNGTFTNNPSIGKVYGVMGVAEATERAFIDRGVKITDAVAFRGWNLQPLYRCGVACLKPWGTCLLVSNDFVDTRLGAPATTSTFVAGSSTGQTKVSAFGKTANAYLYKKGNQNVYNLQALSNGVDSWATLTLNTTNISSVAEGDVVTVVGLNSSGKAIYVSKHVLASTEIA